MAKFFIQTNDKLTELIGGVSYENVIKALGYVPSNFSGNFNDLSDNPFISDDSGEFNIIDESGNIIAKFNNEGLVVVDVIAGEHILSNKADKSEVPSIEGLATVKYVNEKFNSLVLPDVEVDLAGIATEEYVNEKINDSLGSYATKLEVNNTVSNLNFYSVKNNPITDNDSGELSIIDENGNIGFKLSNGNIYVKDVIADGHTLSEKVDKSEITGLATENYVNEKFNSIKIPEVDFTGYATENYVSEEISKIEIPSLGGYATEKWVEDKKYLTEHQDISHLASKVEVNDTVNHSISNMEFYSINNNPVIDGFLGSFALVDENGNIGLKYENKQLHVPDVVSGVHILSNKVDKTEQSTALQTKQDKNLYFTSKSASNWVPDITYNNCSYRCDIPCEGVTANDFAQVVFRYDDSVSGKYAQVCETKTNAVSIWSSVNDPIVIPVIIIFK